MSLILTPADAWPMRVLSSQAENVSGRQPGSLRWLAFSVHHIGGTRGDYREEYKPDRAREESSPALRRILSLVINRADNAPIAPRARELCRGSRAGPVPVIARAGSPWRHSHTCQSVTPAMRQKIPIKGGAKRSRSKTARAAWNHVTARMAIVDSPLRLRWPGHGAAGGHPIGF
jgi:hypothetical protein